MNVVPPRQTGSRRDRKANHLQVDKPVLSAGQQSRPSPSRVFVVDDHPLVRRGLELLISLEPSLILCGEAATAEMALQEILACRPDLAVVDLRLKESDGLELIKQLRAKYSDLRILVFSTHEEAVYLQESLAAGAHGYVTKSEGPETVIKAIVRVLAGECYLSENLSLKLARIGH